MTLFQLLPYPTFIFAAYVTGKMQIYGFLWFWNVPKDQKERILKASMLKGLPWFAVLILLPFLATGKQHVVNSPTGVLSMVLLTSLFWGIHVISQHLIRLMLENDWVDPIAVRYAMFWGIGMGVLACGAMVHSAYF